MAKVRLDHSWITGVVCLLVSGKVIFTLCRRNQRNANRFVLQKYVIPKRPKDKKLKRACSQHTRFRFSKGENMMSLMTHDCRQKGRKESVWQLSVQKFKTTNSSLAVLLVFTSSIF